MTLMHRVARLFRADAHALLDRIEEPDLTLRQAVQEMQEGLDGERRRRNLLEQEVKTLARQRAESSQELERLGEQLDVCFEAGNDDLARGLIRRRLEIQRLDQSLAAREADRREQLEGLKTRLAEQAARLEAMRQRAELLAPRDTESNYDDCPPKMPEPLVRDEEVEVALLEERRRRAGS